jgi:hypothetical protein
MERANSDAMLLLSAVDEAIHNTEEDNKRYEEDEAGESEPRPVRLEWRRAWQSVVSRDKPLMARLIRGPPASPRLRTSSTANTRFRPPTSIHACLDSPECLWSRRTRSPESSSA